MKIEIKKEELVEILLAIFILSLIFSINNFTLKLVSFAENFLLLTIVIFIKELIQKLYAKKIGYHSRLKIYPLSSILSIFVSLIGIKLAAPSYSEILPYKFSDWKFSRKKYSVEDEGKIVLLGLIVILVFCIVFLFMNIKNFKNMMALILIFNMIPILPFDGTKILKWSFSIWSFLFIFSLILLIL